MLFFYAAGGRGGPDRPGLAAEHPRGTALRRSGIGSVRDFVLAAGPGPRLASADSAAFHRGGDQRGSDHVFLHGNRIDPDTAVE